jgi:hypothetical protein
MAEVTRRIFTKLGAAAAAAAAFTTPLRAREAFHASPGPARNLPQDGVRLRLDPDAFQPARPLRGEGLAIDIGGERFHFRPFALELRTGGFSEFSRVEGAEAESIFTSHGGELVGQIYTPSGDFWFLEGRSGGEAVLRKITRAESQPCAADLLDAGLVKESEATTTLPSARRRSSGTPAVVVRIAVPYAAEVLKEAGSEAKIVADVQAVCDQVSAGARQSNCSFFRFEPVYIGPTSLVPAPSLRGSDNIALLRQSEEIARMRRLVGADEVCLLVSESENAGIVPLTASQFVPENGYCVHIFEAMVWSLGLFHEWCHPLGCQHEHGAEIVSANDQFRNARAEVYAPENLDNGWQTVMGNAIVRNTFLRRIPVLSTPERTWKGVPTGTALAWNARMLREGGARVAQYHSSLVG